MRFRVRWPDRTATDCYSPSLVIKDYFAPGQAYELGDFLSLSREALAIASERVRARYGFRCGQAERQLEEIEEIASRFGGDPRAWVTVEAFLGPEGAE